MELITTKFVLASDIGVHGNLFGGTMLSWLDEAGAAFACQFGETTSMVTKHISAVDFVRPVKQGRIVKIYGDVVAVGNSSITIFLEARRHNPLSGSQKTVCEINMVFVRIDDEGEPLPLSKKVKDKNY